MWKRTANGQVLHFYLAGINNQNFLMRDRETGSWWQQITGRAIYGPLRGATLDPVLSDELTYGEWKSEFPAGRVLAPVAKFSKDYESDWEPHVAKLPVVISFPGTKLKSRDLVIGLEINGSARAYPWDVFAKQSPVVDRVNGTPLLLVLGPDGKSFRAFVSRIDGRDADFFLKTDSSAERSSLEKAPQAEALPARTLQSQPSAVGNATQSEASSVQNAHRGGNGQPSPSWLLFDSLTGSEWNFQGCAISGPTRGKCLERVLALKDYWFDWRNYHPGTSVYSLP